MLQSFQFLRSPLFGNSRSLISMTASPPIREPIHFADSSISLSISPFSFSHFIQSGHFPSPFNCKTSTLATFQFLSPIVHISELSTFPILTVTLFNAPFSSHCRTNSFRQFQYLSLLPPSHTLSNLVTSLPPSILRQARYPLPFNSPPLSSTFLNSPLFRS
jgi:hypothetical protein